MLWHTKRTLSMGTFIQGLRYGLRMLAKNPGFTALAVVTLALGIGANLTIFSWIRATILDPIPAVTHTSDLVTVMRGEISEHPTPPFSYLDYVDLRKNNRSLSGLIGYHDDFMTLTGAGKPERIYGALTSADYFSVLGVRPILGRGFLESEERASAGAPVVVIGYGLWQSHFEGDRSVLGKSVQINRHTYTVIGVAPEGFQGCKTGLRTDVWIPLVMDRFVWGPNRPDDRSLLWLNVLGRLKPGASRRQAEADLNIVMQEIVQRFPAIHQGPNQITLDPLWRSPFGANVYLYKSLPILLALAGVLLLLACANVANLLLVRSVTRRREIALRLSMGASRWRLVRQFLLESLVLALMAGGVATLMTTWTANTLAAFFPANSLPLTVNGRMDLSVLLASLLAAVLTALVFGTLPALRISRLAPVAVLKEEALSVSGGLHRSRLSSLLVIAQISLSLLLLICAGLFTRSLEIARRADPGFDPNHVMLASYELAPAGYSEEQGIEFSRQLLDRLAALPGVQSVTAADFSPLSFTIHSDSVLPEGYLPRPHEDMEIDRAVVGPDYLRTLGTTLVAGRDFSIHDGAMSQPVAMVNEEFVARYWPGLDPLGRRVAEGGTWFKVVGVVHNGKYRRLTYSPTPCIFLSLFQAYNEPVILHVRVAGDPQAFAPTLEKSIHELNADLPVFQVMPLNASMRMGSIFERVATTFVGVFGLLALALASVGIYGVVAYTTRQRTHEIGVRMALGARRGHVLLLILRQGLGLTLAGLAIGFGLAFGLTPLLRSSLYGVAATDLATYSFVGATLCLVALVACYIPARRATKVEPVMALRYE